MGSNKDTPSKHLPLLFPTRTAQFETFQPSCISTHRQNRGTNTSHSLTEDTFQFYDDRLPVLTVEQLLRLGVALPVRGCCCVVKAAAILLMSFGSGSGALAGAAGAGLSLSLDQDGTSERAMPAADT